jgi:hypothetical protein
VDRVPVLPAGDEQGPEQALGQGHEELVPEGDVGDHVPGGGIADAGEIALFEAQIGEGRELLAARHRLQDRQGNLVVVEVVGQVVKVGTVVEAHGLLGRGGRRRVGIVGGRGMSVDRRCLDRLCELEDGTVGHVDDVVSEYDEGVDVGGRGLKAGVEAETSKVESKQASRPSLTQPPSTEFLSRPPTTHKPPRRNHGQRKLANAREPGPGQQLSVPPPTPNKTPC